MSRISKLFSDWLSVQKSDKVNEARILLSVGNKRSTYYNGLIEAMGVDGKKLDSLFQENKNKYGETIVEQKKALAEELIHAMGGTVEWGKKDGTVMTTIGQSYYPIADRSNSMESVVEEGDRDVLLHIRNAVVGGNFMIAEELIKNAWGRLTLKERNGLIEWVNNMNQYNTNGHKSRPAKFKPMESRGDMKKEEFIEGFLTTAKENMKIS
jgi:hypothetical protein